MQANRPTICFLVGGREGGGSAHSTLQLIQRIDRSKYEVMVAACEAGSFTKRIADTGQSIDILGTGWPPSAREPTATGARHRLGGYLSLPGWLFRTTLALTRSIKHNRIDLVHTNYHHFHLVAGLTPCATRRKCVWHWRGSIRAGRELKSDASHSPKPGITKDSRWAIVMKLGWLVRLTMSRCVWSIANSEVTGKSVRQLTGDRLTVVYNGVDLAESPQDRIDLRTLLNLQPETRIVGLVGSLHPMKGQMIFLQAASRICKRYPDVHFVCIGGQTAAKQQEYEQSLIAKRAALDLECQVHLMGRRTDASTLVADFDVATVCTLPPGEGFGLVTVEAMAQHVPVISTDQGAAREIVVDGETGILIPAGDATALASAIETLLDSESVRSSMGEAGYKRCREEFDISRTVREVEAVYDKALARSR